MKRWILIGLAAVVLLLGIAIVAIPALVPASFIKDRVVAGVKDATGRDLVIRGPLKVSVLPTLAVAVNDVSFANAAGAKHPAMMTLSAMEVELKLLPLLSGRTEIDRFVLVKPVIHLEVDRQGRANWQFKTAEAKPAGETAGAAPGEVNLGEVRLVDGTVTYDNAQTGASYTISNANLAVEMPSFAAPFRAKGDLVYNGQKLDISASAGSLGSALEGKATPVALSVAGQPLKLSLDGQGAVGASPTFNGTVDLAVPSIKALAAWAGSPIEARENTMGPLSIKGKLGVGANRYSFTDAAIALDAIRATGALAADTKGARPSLDGKLAVGALDLNPYLPPEAAQPQAQQQGAGEWSSEPIDLAALKAVDANFDLSVESLKARKLQIGKSVVALNLKNGRLQTDLKEMALYGGAGTGRIVLDGSGAVPVVEPSFKLTGVQLQPLLKDAADSDRLSGTGALDFALAGRGRSQRDIVASLGGKGSLDFRDGAIKGFNLAEIVQTVRDLKGAVTGGSVGVEKQTDFSELTGTFQVASGVVRNDDLQMKSPLLRVTGKGTVELLPRTVNYRLDPKLAATTKGQGGREDVTGFGVPVVIKGPWHDLSYQPDLSGLLANPGAALDTLKGAVGGALPIPGAPSGSGTTGTGTTGSGTTGGSTQPAVPSLPGALKGILGR